VVLERRAGNQTCACLCGPDVRNHARAIAGRNVLYLPSVDDGFGTRCLPHAPCCVSVVTRELCLVLIEAWNAGKPSSAHGCRHRELVEDGVDAGRGTGPGRLGQRWGRSLAIRRSPNAWPQWQAEVDQRFAWPKSRVPTSRSTRGCCRAGAGVKARTNVLGVGISLINMRWRSIRSTDDPIGHVVLSVCTVHT